MHTRQIRSYYLADLIMYNCNSIKILNLKRERKKTKLTFQTHDAGAWQDLALFFVNIKFVLACGTFEQLRVHYLVLVVNYFHKTTLNLFLFFFFIKWKT